MKKVSSLKKRSNGRACKIELFDTTGGPIGEKVEPILFSKIVSRDGINTWVLLHQN